MRESHEVGGKIAPRCLGAREGEKAFRLLEIERTQLTGCCSIS